MQADFVHPDARAVLCDALPVHAPPADGLTRGRPVQLLRVGPLHDALTGESLLDVTDEFCAAIAATASAAGFAVPVDHGHSLYRSQAAGGGGDVPLFGRIVELDARPGSGLWGVPEWTQAGLAMLSASPGLLYLSPTLMSQAHDPRTGDPMPGRSLHSVSLTPTPRQDGLDTLALSRQAGGGLMADPTPRTPAATPEVVTLSRVDHAALLDRVTGAECRVTELSAQLAAKDEAVNAAASEALTLATRIQALEGDKAAREFADLCKTHEARGVFISPEMRVTLAKLSAADATVLLSQMPATRPPVEQGHGATTRPVDPNSPDVIRSAVELAKAKGASWSDALKLARAGGVA